MHHQGERCAGSLSHVHLGDRDANTNACSLLVVRRKQNRDEVAKKRPFSISSWYRAHKILSTSKSDQAAGQLLGHIFF
jgi:hypothetical protein